MNSAMNNVISLCIVNGNFIIFEKKIDEQPTLSAKRFLPSRYHFFFFFLQIFKELYIFKLSN